MLQILSLNLATLKPKSSRPALDTLGPWVRTKMVPLLYIYIYIYMYVCIN